MGNKQMIGGKIALVLNNCEVALNIGAEQGVKVGMCFKTDREEKDDEVRDPDTNELLGVIARTKIRFKVCEIKRKICIAGSYVENGVRSYKPLKINIGDPVVQVVY